MIAGAKYAAPSACASLKPKEIKKCKVYHEGMVYVMFSIEVYAQKSSTLFEKSDSTGWCLKAELVVNQSCVEGT